MIDVENAINIYYIGILGDTKKNDSTSNASTWSYHVVRKIATILRTVKTFNENIKVPTYTHGMIIPYIYLLQRDPYLLTTSEQTALF